MAQPDAALGHTASTGVRDSFTRDQLHRTAEHTHDEAVHHDQWAVNRRELTPPPVQRYKETLLEAEPLPAVAA